MRDLLRSAILAGAYGDGPLPFEHELTAAFGVSRGVIRDAFQLLRDEGLIDRQRGAGTFVVTPALSGRRIDALDNRLEVPDHTRTHRDVLSIERVPAPAMVAERLEVAPGTDVYFHERINLLDGMPTTLRSGWITEALGERFDAAARRLQAPVLHVIEHVLGCRVASADMKVEACLVDATTGPALQAPVGAPLLLIERLFRDEAGAPVELSYSRIRGDRLFLHVHLE